MNPADDLDFVIKVCGITEAADGAFALQAGANALGFNFYGRSPRCISAERAATLRFDHSQHPHLRVGVFVNATAAELQQTAEVAQLDVLQLHGSLPETLPHSYRIWRAIAPDTRAGLRPDIEAYLLDTPSDAFGGSGVCYDWRLAAAFPGRAILAGGLHAGNVAEAIAAARPWGVDACSRLESSPGRKDAVRMAQFLQAAHAAFLATMSTQIPV